MWIIAILLLLGLAGCGGPARRSSLSQQVAPDRPSFLTRVHEDCVTGQRWACDMLNALSNAERSRDAR